MLISYKEGDKLNPQKAKLKKKPIDLKPDPFNIDINLSYILKASEVERNLSNLFIKVQSLPIQDFNTTSQFGEVEILKDMLHALQDNHEIILEISKKYSPSKLVDSYLLMPKQNQQSKILCLIPLVRAQVEGIFTTILLLGKPKKMFKKFIQTSWVNNYAIEIFKIKEYRKLKRFSKTAGRKVEELRKLILNKYSQERLKKKLNKKELARIEKLVDLGNIENLEKFPTPYKAILEFKKGRNINPTLNRSKLIKVLKKIYIRYMWLCLYMHGSEMQNFAGRSLRTGNINLAKKLNENVLEMPLRELDYLSLTMIFTIYYIFIKQPMKILIDLNDLWEKIEQYSLLGKYAWDTWTNKVFGQI